MLFTIFVWLGLIVINRSISQSSTPLACSLFFLGFPPHESTVSNTHPQVTLSPAPPSSLWYVPYILPSTCRLPPSFTPPHTTKQRINTSAALLLRLHQIRPRLRTRFRIRSRPRRGLVLHRCRQRPCSRQREGDGERQRWDCTPRIPLSRGKGDKLTIVAHRR